MSTNVHKLVHTELGGLVLLVDLEDPLVPSGQLDQVVRKVLQVHRQELVHIPSPRTLGLPWA